MPEPLCESVSSPVKRHNNSITFTRAMARINSANRGKMLKTDPVI